MKYRSSRPEVLCKKGVLKNFANFTGKNLYWSLFFNKVAGFQPAWNFIKKEIPVQLFFCKFFSYFVELLQIAASVNNEENYYF